MRLSAQLYFILLFNISIFISASAQKKWKKVTLEKANTAKDADYMTAEEKGVIFYYNLVRLEPELFMETYAKKYIDSTGEKSGYVKSLNKTLKSLKSEEVLMPSEKLYLTAEAHALDFGKSGQIGHGNFAKRFQKYVKDCECEAGENCDYGNDQALIIVMRLLIDEDISNLSHRNNILNPSFKNIGVSISPHKKYVWNCVMDLGAAPRIH